MIHVTDTIEIEDQELEFEFVRASGPGGQRVNKVSTAVQLRFDVERSPSLPDDVRARLGRIAGKRMNDEGMLVIRAQRYRSQLRNREDALARLIALIRKAAKTPTRREPTQPSRAEKERRLNEKRRRAQIKEQRRSDPDIDA